MTLIKKQSFSIAALIAIAIVGVGCGSSGGSEPTTNTTSSTTGSTPAPAGDLKGDIAIDGSSTVFPISQAAAEDFMAENSGVKITVSESGTGGGMKKFVAGEIDICDASRPIESEEVEKAKAAGIEFVEIPVAFDGLSVVVNKENSFVDHLTVDELKKIWEPTSKVSNWKDVRAGFPDVPMKLYGPDTASGTFEYFTEAIVKKKKSSRADYTASSDDNVLVTGVSGDKGSLGYFGFHYYVENQDKLKIVKIDAGKGAIEPTEATINDGTYNPLSRPLFIYVKKSALERPEVKAFIQFYLGEKGQSLVKESGYVLLPKNAYELGLKRASEMKTGTVFQGVQPGIKIEDVLSKEGA